MRMRSTWQHGPFETHDIKGQNFENVIYFARAFDRLYGQPEGEAFLDIIVPSTTKIRKLTGEALLLF